MCCSTGFPLFGGAFASHPRLAFDGNDILLVVWEDHRFGHGDVFGVRLSLTSGLDESSFPIASGSTEQVSPAVAYTGSQFLVGAEKNSTRTGIY